MRTFLPALSVSLALGLLLGCQSKQATVTGESQLASAAASPPTVVYVADFTLPPEIIQSESGVLSGRSGPVGRVGNRLSGTSEDRAARARQLVDLMSKSLVNDLSKAKIKAVRLTPESAVPAQGWLVRGSFTVVDEGNRLRRSMIGMGQGETDIQVLSCIDDLSQGPPRPMYQVATDANSGKAIGGGATLTFGPYGAAVHFVKAGQDIEKNVKQTASQIADLIVKRVQQPISKTKESRALPVQSAFLTQLTPGERLVHTPLAPARSRNPLSGNEDDPTP
jgi:hypothetical protein